MSTNVTTKSLSTNTLSLRFMKNAHRAKQMEEVELDPAEAKYEWKQTGNGKLARSFEILEDYPGKFRSEFILNRCQHSLAAMR